MRAEFSIRPLPIDSTTDAPQGGGPNARLGPLSTVVEGSWKDILTVIQRCHQAVAHQHERVLTTIVIDDQHPRRRNGSANPLSVDNPRADRVPLTDMDLEC